jgi:hypothetical protein
VLSWSEEIFYTNYFSEGWLFNKLGDFLFLKTFFQLLTTALFVSESTVRFNELCSMVHGVRSTDACPGTEERQKYYTNLFETSALVWNGGQHPRRGGFTPV